MHSSSSSDPCHLLDFRYIDIWIREQKPVVVLSSILFLSPFIMGYNFSCRQSLIVADNVRILNVRVIVESRLLSATICVWTGKLNLVQFSQLLVDQSQTVCNHVRSNCVRVHTKFDTSLRRSTAICDGLRLLNDFIEPGLRHTTDTSGTVSNTC